MSLHFLVGCLQFPFFEVLQHLRLVVHKNKSVCLECLTFSNKLFFLLVGQCYSTFARSLRIAWRVKEQLLCRRGMWKGQKSWQHLLYHILRPAVWIQWKETVGQVGGAEGEFCSVCPVIFIPAEAEEEQQITKGTQHKLATSSKSHWASATLWLTPVGKPDKMALLLGRGILLIIETSSFSSLSVTVTALLDKQRPEVALATPVLSFLSWPA